ncbi:MAG TPA: ABC transporter permease subunit [Stellaceae bacterium]|nr:ABC transporter permease subunit [Stellaceae bacterium]
MTSPSLTTPRIEPSLPVTRRLSFGRRDRRGAGFVWLSAALAAMVLVLLVTVLWLSLTTGVPAIPGGPYSLANITSMLGSAETWQVMANTLVFACVATAIAMLGGIAVGWVVERTDFRAKQTTYAAMTVLLLVPGFFPAMGWLFLLGPRIGVIGRWLHDGFGIDQNAVTIANPFGMGWVQGLLLVPLAFVLVGPPLRAVAGELIEAAEISGVGAWQRACKIELPLVLPALTAAAIFCFMVAVASFDVPAIIGMTYRQFTFSSYVYQLLNPQAGVPQYGPPAALSLLVMVVAFALTAVYLKAIRRGRAYQVVTGRGYRLAPHPLGRARFWIYAGFTGYFLLSFVLPLLLVLWVAFSRYFRPPSLAALQGLSFANFENAPWAMAWRGLQHTLMLMIGVPVCAVILGLVVSWVVVRSRARLREAIDVVLFLPHAVPAIVFAVAMQTLALFVIGPFVQLAGTVWIIAIVYVMTYLTFAVRAMSVAVVQIGNELEDAAYVAGLGVGGTLRRIFLPLVAQAAVSAWVWIALLVFRELTMAVVLATPANLTLPTVIWSTWYTGEMGQATAMSLVFMLLFLPLALVYLIGRRARGREAAPL